MTFEHVILLRLSPPQAVSLFLYIPKHRFKQRLQTSASPDNVSLESGSLRHTMITFGPPEA
jgi:hypothetical protein